MFDDLLYVKFRQQELWREAAAQALAAQFQPERRRWSVRAFEALKKVFSASTWRTAERVHPCALPAVLGMVQPNNGGKNV